MENQFFERPILNSLHEYPARHWELDDSGQPTQRVIESRHPATQVVPHWVPGVSHLASHGRWVFAEFTDVYVMQDGFAKKVEAELDKMIETATEVMA